MSDYSNLQIHDVIKLAKKAGDRIMFYRGKVSSISKSDGSPVTKADKEASDIIIKGLNKITPSIPVISEEASKQENMKAMQSSLRWVVDPIDGTRTFLDGRAGFGVHIGLVKDGEPIRGVVYFPAKGKEGRFYFTGDDGVSYKQEGINGTPEKIEVSKKISKPNVRAAVHYKPEKRPKNIAGQFYDAVFGVGGGRICLVAEGKADVGWMALDGEEWAFAHWDVAAAHAILKAAGGDLLDIKTGDPITYSNDNFSIKNAIAGKPSVIKKLGIH